MYSQTLLQDQNTQKLALQQQLLEKDAKLNELESALERLQVEKPDTTNILATIESDKVAASRAVAQNQELKQQLEEIQTAYIQVVNQMKFYFFTICSWNFKFFFFFGK